MSSTRYQSLLSPIKVGNVWLKNRLVSCTSLPHYIQGNERFPADSMIEHMLRRAKGGPQRISSISPSSTSSTPAARTT